jgi:hypothetical protein
VHEFLYSVSTFQCLTFILVLKFCDVGLYMGSKDNMTALIVKLSAQVIGQGGGVLGRRQQRDAEKNGNKSGT